MASRAGAPLRTAGLRPLGLPRPARVEVDAHDLPSRVTLGAAGREGHALEVEQVDEVWRIAEEWWRETPIGRTYYRVIVDGGRALTLFRDELLLDGGGASMWFEQQY